MGLEKYIKEVKTHWIGKTGNEYLISEYINHGHGGLYRGFKDLPKEEYPYTLKYEKEYVFKCCGNLKEDIQ